MANLLPSGDSGMHLRCRQTHRPAKVNYILIIAYLVKPSCATRHVGLGTWLDACSFLMHSMLNCSAAHDESITLPYDGKLLSSAATGHPCKLPSQLPQLPQDRLQSCNSTCRATSPNS